MCQSDICSGVEWHRMEIEEAVHRVQLVKHIHDGCNVESQCDVCLYL